MANAIDTKVGQIRTFFKKNQPKNHPILEHPISKCEEYVRGLYFDMLCVMAQYENEDVENQNCFIQRIMAGCEETMPITEHIKRAMEINADKVTEFLKQCRENNLNEIFFVDSLLIACANGVPNKKQVEFLAEIGDVLGFDKVKIQNICELALAILEQDFEKLKSAANQESVSNDAIVDAMYCYIHPIIESNIINTDQHMYIYNLKLRSNPKFENSRYIIKNKYEVIIENQLIYNSTIDFKSVKSVIIRNCKICDISDPTYYPIFDFIGVKYVIIENCIFNNTKNVFSFQNTDCEVQINNCKFINCEKYSGSTIVYSSNYNSIDFTSCEFQSCSSIDGYGIISYNNNVSAINCVFQDCRSGRSLFEGGSFNGNNNQIIGCCQLKC